MQCPRHAQHPTPPPIITTYPQDRHCCCLHGIACRGVVSRRASPSVELLPGIIFPLPGIYTMDVKCGMIMYVKCDNWRSIL